MTFLERDARSCVKHNLKKLGKKSHLQSEAGDSCWTHGIQNLLMRQELHMAYV
eukprot:jgi/Psemu1/16265/gm1.16265_g